jgi:transcription antitermination factor NusG
VSSTGKGYKYLDEKAVTRDSLGFQVNSEVVVMGGEYRGWEGVVLAIKGDNRGDRRFKVELALNGE